MPYQVIAQYFDLGSGHHVIELGDGRGHKHVLQIAAGFDSCVACGRVTAVDNHAEIDPKAEIRIATDALNALEERQIAYAKKHGIKLK